MGRIYFVRHGETVWNREKRIAGSTDVALTEKGREEAEERGKDLAAMGLKVDRIYSSPLSRAYDTALIIASHLKVEVEKDERLREQDFGYWEGVAPGDRKEDFIRDKMCFMKKYGNGESMLETAHRVYSFIDEKRKESGDILVVAHNGIARFFHAYFNEMTNEEFAHYSVPNCSVTVYEK